MNAQPLTERPPSTPEEFVELIRVGAMTFQGLMFHLNIEAHQDPAKLRRVSAMLTRTRYLIHETDTAHSAAA